MVLISALSETLDRIDIGQARKVLLLEGGKLSPAEVDEVVV